VPAIVCAVLSQELQFYERGVACRFAIGAGDRDVARGAIGPGMFQGRGILGFPWSTVDIGGEAGGLAAVAAFLTAGKDEDSKCGRQCENSEFFHRNY